MALRDLHTHSCFCDGENTPEEMVLAAIEKGLECIGICAHSPVDFDRDYFLPAERFGEFQAEMARLKAKYADRIEVLCGLELDIFSDVDSSGFDYIIGSVHYVEADGDYISVDESFDILRNGCEKHFGGDYLALAERYYATLGCVAEKTGCDIIGHFDLITLNNDGNRMFVENNPRYVSAWKAAADALLESGKVFEINTGAQCKGRREVPYPAPAIQDYITARGGRFIRNSDAHKAENIAYNQ